MHRLNVILWSDPWTEGGAIIRKVWTGWINRRRVLAR